MRTEQEKMRLLLDAVLEGFARGENAMALSRKLLEAEQNDIVGTLLSYDLQTGRYNSRARARVADWKTWCSQLAGVLRPYFPRCRTLLEVGCGEATTMGGVLEELGGSAADVYGFDISWSRISEGRAWLGNLKQNASLFVADLFRIPLADNSVDVVYTSHSLEPNGGREEAALRECLRVARSAVVCVEPLYELANAEQRQHMQSHGYVRGLRAAASALGASIQAFELFPYAPNPLNPSGVMILEKHAGAVDHCGPLEWQCPLTAAPMECDKDMFCVPRYGLVYPVLRGVPLLRTEHVVVASKLNPPGLARH